MTARFRGTAERAHYHPTPNPMDDLAALEAAIIDAPTDRTVRLVYADALDESGDPMSARRAEFIRKHIELEALPPDQPQCTALVARCDDLFADHWVDWWRPVCAAVGLPAPFTPKRVRRGARHALGAPYQRATDSPGVYSVSSEAHGFTAQFIGGFPELLSVTAFTHDALNRPFANWFAAAPFCRLRFGTELTEFEWATVDGPHLAWLSELVLDRLSLDVATLAVRSRHLRALTELKALPLRPAAAIVRALVHKPAWAGLRSLTLTGVTPPDAVQALAERCTLDLESLSLGLSEVPEPPTSSGFTGAIGAMLSEVLTRFFSLHPLPPGPIRWSDYWPSLLALARAPFLRNLRTLQLTDTGPATNFVGGLIARLQLTDAPAVTDPDAMFPDALIRSLADGLNPDRLIRLELPATRLTPAARADLAHRFGPRFVPA